MGMVLPPNTAGSGSRMAHACDTTLPCHRSHSKTVNHRTKILYNDFRPNITEIMLNGC